MFRVLLLTLIAFFSFGVEGFIIKEFNRRVGFHSVKEEERTIYLTEDAIIVETEKDFFIQKVENGKPKLYRVLKKSKTYIDASDNAVVILTTIPFLDCKEQKCKLKKDVLKPTDEYKEIRGYRARKILVESPISIQGHGAVIQWYTKDWKELVEANRTENRFYVNFIKAVMKERGLTEENIPLKELETFLEEIAQKYGGVIRTEQKFGRFHPFSEILSVERGEIPEEIYRLPEGYEEMKHHPGFH